jgi:hypothetical protein
MQMAVLAVDEARGHNARSSVAEALESSEEVLRLVLLTLHLAPLDHFTP